MPVKKDVIDVFLQGYGEKGTKLAANSRIAKMLRDCASEAHLVLSSVRKVADGMQPRLTCSNVTAEGKGPAHYVMHLTGGENHRATWGLYLSRIALFTMLLQRTGREVWVITINNDCLDDVHDIFIGMSLT